MLTKQKKIPKAHIRNKNKNKYTDTHLTRKDESYFKRPFEMMQLQKKCLKNIGQLANRLALADREGMRLGLT